MPVLLHRRIAGIWATIRSGDMLFIDSSHIAMPGTDVDRLFLDILPRLPAGAIVHVHDIMLPDAYPESWSWRGYNEQIARGGASARQRLRVAVRQPLRLEADAQCRICPRSCHELPLSPGAHETSLWLRKR